MMDTPSPTLKCVVIGAGPVGALTALYAARRGWQVEVYELRGDLRFDETEPLNFTKSINLALSERGINSLRHLNTPGLVENVLSSTIPMHGRMIHGVSKDGELTATAQLYDVHGRYIRAVDRADLNCRLLDELDDLPNVDLYFYHKLTGVDFQRKLAWLEKKGTSRPASSAEYDRRASRRPGRPDEIEVDFDLIIGCDGAHSSVRFHMMKFVRMDFAQSYIDTLWCEFTIPPVSETTAASHSGRDGFAISPNHLHIWPGDDKMFIAIPSNDKTFTCTLFATSRDFTALEKDPDSVVKYFSSNFPGAVELIGAEELREQLEINPHLPLVNIKCSPYHFGSTGVIVGDAAHAMVPFYGQGMNAGLEDVRVLFEHLDAQSQSDHGRAKALASYTAQRVPDAHTINDLALANYWEMHAGVKSSTYLLRKAVEEFLSDKLPSTGFATQYSRVSFSNQRYSEVAKAVTRQKHVLINAMVSTALISTTAAAVWLITYIRKLDSLPNLLTSLMSIGTRLMETFKSTFEQ